MRIKSYNHFLILEKYDKNIREKLIELGVTDEDELNKQIHYAKRGHLGTYLEEKGEQFTFGMLNAIFKDARDAKVVTDVKKGFIKMIPRVIPLALSPFFPTLAILGMIFGTSRAFNKIFDPILNWIHPESKYSDFLKKMVDTYMKIPEGEINMKDRFTRSFVVSDRLVEAIKPEVLEDFSILLSNKMEKEDSNKVVPDHYIENNLKEYLNEKFDIDPKIPTK